MGRRRSSDEIYPCGDPRTPANTFNDGVTDKCRLCLRSRAKAYYHANKEKARQYAAAYYRTHKRKGKAKTKVKREPVVIEVPTVTGCALWDSWRSGRRYGRAAIRAPRKTRASTAPSAACCAIAPQCSPGCVNSATSAGAS